MTMIRLLWIALLGVLVVLPIETAAQGLTGALIGTVKGPDGAVIPGAVVRVTSPALLGGERRTTSGDRGQWRLQVLPPGTYVLTVDDEVDESAPSISPDGWPIGIRSNRSFSARASSRSSRTRAGVAHEI
jgi:Carboxypeptidase regulatory-like domain